MARLRYVRSLDQVKKAADSNPEFMKNTVRSCRAWYETDPAIARALVPKPLEPALRPEIFVQFAHVAMHVSAQNTIEIGAATVGVACSYDGTPGHYVLAMPMEGEQVVIGGRETYGEPKKLAKIDFEVAGDRIRAAATRKGVSFLELRGAIGKPLDRPLEFTEYLYCFKALPSCVKGEGFDGDPLLVRLEWRRNYRSLREVTGEVILRESAFDPLADVEVQRVVRMEYCEGGSQTNGRVLRSIPGEWLLPFLHQRYDDTSCDGIELATAGAARA